MLLPISLGILAGTTVLHYYTDWPPSARMLIISVLSLLVSFSLVWKISSVYIVRIVVFFIFFQLAWLMTGYYVKMLIKSYPVKTLSGKQIIQGTLDGVLEKRGRHTQWDMLLPEHPGWKVRLYSTLPLTAREGDVFQVQVELFYPWGTANPGGVDQAKHFWLQRVVATGHVIAILQHQKSTQWSLSYWRQNIAKRIERVLGTQSLVGVIQAMTVGIRQSITAEEWDIFQRTGTSHVVAISGLHIGWVAGCIGYLGMRVIRRSMRLTLTMPVQHYGAGLSIVAALLYSALAGFSVPTKRACGMIVVGMLMQCMRRPIAGKYGLALTCVMLILYDPLVVLQLGFWLSVICVVILLLNASSRSDHYVVQMTVPAVVMFTGLLPVNAFYFHQISLVSIVANILFLPVVSFIIVPTGLLGAMGVPGGLAIAHHALCMSWKVLSMLAACEWGVIPIGAPTNIILGVAGLGTVTLLLPRGIPLRLLGSIGWLPLFWNKPHVIAPGEFRLTMLDVGQGLAVVVQTKTHALIYDTGPAQASGSNAGRQIMVPFLNAEGIRHVDRIIISHTDLDHRGGLLGLPQAMKRAVICSEPERLPVPARACVAGERWQWDDVEFMFLGPLQRYATRNNISCVLKIRALNGKSALLTGDIEARAENDLITYWKEALRSEVLVVPHHGSLTSSSVEFIDAVSPDYALIPAGRDNRYGLPRDAVLSRYAARGIQTLISWRTGAIIFQFDQNSPLTPPVCWRDTFRYHWNTIERSGDRDD